MIKSNELREGNWIKYYHGIFKVEPLTIFNVSNEPQFYEPIELTEEILLKCGFEQEDNLFRLHLVNSLSIIFNSKHNLWCFDIYMDTSRIELQYLHELQNIYSSITFKELEINL